MEYGTLGTLRPRRVLPISALAVAIGVFAACGAAALLKLISFFTDLFFYQRFSTTPLSPAGHHLGALVPPAFPILSSHTMHVAPTPSWA